MLHYNTVLPGLLQTLRLLMPLPELAGFRLVGGTALSLQLGHRMSDDIDLFTDKSFDVPDLSASMREAIPGLEISLQTRNGLQCIWQGCKVDIYNWAVPFGEAPLQTEGIRMGSLKDIAAFKLDAITSRQTQKDYYDLYFLLQRFSLTELLAHYRLMFGTMAGRGPVNALTKEYTIRAREGEAARLMTHLPFDDVENFLAEAAKQCLRDAKLEKETEVLAREQLLQELLARKKGGQ